MRTHSRSTPERSNLWKLPDIVNVDVKQAHYDPPKQFWVNREILEVHDGLELMVQLSEPLPSRAVTPALYIGDTAILEYDTAGPNLYRFYVINPLALEPGAPISFGWPNLPKEQLVRSTFRFNAR